MLRHLVHATAQFAVDVAGGKTGEQSLVLMWNGGDNQV